MIYTEDSNFPYPILTSASNSYNDADFDLDILGIESNTESYCFKLEYRIESDFISTLLKSGIAKLMLVIKSIDSSFFYLEFDQKEISVSKSRLSLSKKTVMQLLIKSNEDVSFKDNNDLSDFYSKHKCNILVEKNCILGFSNTVIFNGITHKPLDLFEKKIDRNLDVDFEIELASEIIIIKCKNSDLLFTDSTSSKHINNAYVYMGLIKALCRFIINYGDDDGEVDIDKIDAPENVLDLKIYSLMRNRKIDSLNMENIDRVIQSVSDKIINKFSTAVRRGYQ